MGVCCSAFSDNDLNPPRDKRPPVYRLLFKQPSGSMPILMEEQNEDTLYFRNVVSRSSTIRPIGVITP
jgi:hypothetical protein